MREVVEHILPEGPVKSLAATKRGLLGYLEDIVVLGENEACTGPEQGQGGRREEDGGQGAGKGLREENRSVRIMFWHLYTFRNKVENLSSKCCQSRIFCMLMFYY